MSQDHWKVPCRIDSSRNFDEMLGKLRVNDEIVVQPLETREAISMSIFLGGKPA